MDFSYRLAVIVYTDNSRTKRGFIQIVDVEADDLDMAVALAWEFAQYRYGKDHIEIETNVKGISKIKFGE